MDHTHAQVTEFNPGNMHTMVVLSNHTHKESGPDEHQANNRAQQANASFYGKISALIREYDDVLLFGPTTAKNELANLLKDDHLFANINIVVQQSDNLNQHDQHMLIRNHFTKGEG